MRILIITIQYYPALNPNVFRWAAIAEHWTQQGHEVHILCARRRGVANESEINKVHVHRAGQASLLDMMYNLLNARQRRGELSVNKPVNKSKIRLWVEKLVDFTWRMIYWPDGSCVWYFAAKKRAVKLQQIFDFEAVTSVTQPFTPHLVAAALKRRFPQIQWLMDIEDPFAFSEAIFINNRRLYQHFNYKQEGRLLAQADAVSVTVDTAIQRYKQHFPLVINKIAAIPPMYSLPKTAEKFTVTPDKIHIGYFGAFYHPIRTPDILLELFQKLNNPNLVLHFFGEIAPVFQPVFTKYAAVLPNLQLHGLVTRAQVAAAMEAMHVLVNVGNTTDYHLPSKCVDYMMSGKPIINLSYSSPDPFSDFMQPYPMVLHVDVRAGLNDSHVEKIHAFIVQNQDEKIAQAPLEALIKPYTVARIADQYWHLLQKRAD